MDVDWILVDFEWILVILVDFDWILHGFCWILVDFKWILVATLLTLWLALLLLAVLNIGWAGGLNNSRTHLNFLRFFLGVLCYFRLPAGPGRASP